MKITWLGHAAFRVEFADKVVIIDPFLSGNPALPEALSVEEATKGATHVVLSHGHDDHIGDTGAIAKANGAMVVANFEIAMWAQSQGIDNINPMSTGGNIDVGGFHVALTVAHHSSSSLAGGHPPVYMGNPNGIVINAPGEKVLYHAGDTDVFSDMALIAEIHAPDIAILPIGDRFTMGAKTAAMAATRFLKPKHVIPCHYGTFPILDQTADAFVSEMAGTGIDVEVMQPGGSLTL